jgi:dTDP-4-dehydrorhamnose 3,5-epimerase
MYDMSTPHAPGYEGGVHHQDPTLAIQWPLPVASISDRDAALPRLERVRVV